MSGTFFIIKQNKTKIAALLLALLLAACGGGSANIKDSSSSGLSITKPEKQSGVQQRTSGSQNTGVSVTLPDKDLVRERIEDGMPYHKAIMDSQTAELMKSVPNVSNDIFLGGDILIEEEMLNYMEDYGYDYPIKGIEPILRGHDIVFANLETPIGDKGIPAKGKPYIFMINEDYAAPIKKLHLNIVSIANNHIMDYGESGLFSTMDWLNDNKIAFTGAGKDLNEARTPVIINSRGIEFVFLAYNERPPAYFAATKKSPGAAPARLSIIEEDVKLYKKPTNIVMVSIHWGIEQTLYPQAYQVEMAHKIIDAGADCIIGHHPHWIQGIEIYKQKPVFYSLGNMLNGFYNRVEQDNFFAVMKYRGLKLRRIEIIPVAGKNTMTDFQPYILTGDEAKEHLTLIKNISARFNTHFVIKKDIGVVLIH